MTEEQSRPPAATVSNASVLSSALWSALAAIVSAPLLIVSTVLVARVLGVSDFGKYALYAYITLLLVGLADLGVGTSLLRGGALAAGRDDEADLLRFVRAGTSWSMLQLPWAVLVGCVVLPGLTAKLLFAAAMVAALGFLGPSHYLVMTSSLRWASQVKVMSLVLSTTALLTTAVLTGDPATTFAAGLLGTHALSVVQVLAVPRHQRLAVLRPGPLRLSRSDVAFGFGTLLHNQLNGFVFSRSEVLFFGSDQSKALGTFASSQTVAARSTLIIDVFLGAVPSALTSAYGRGPETFMRAFQRASEALGILFALTTPLLSVAVVACSPLLFGDEFDGIAAPALALSLTALLQSGMGPVLVLQYARKSIKPMIVAGLLAAGLDALLSALLIPGSGVTGAVVASAVSGTVYVVIAPFTYFRDPTWRPLLRTHVTRVGLCLIASGALGAALLQLSPLEGLLVGVPTALVVSLLLLRLPGARVSHDGLAALLEASPARLRPAVAVVQRLAPARSASPETERH